MRRVVDAPTVIYIPFNIHYAHEFSVWATSKEAKWDIANQIKFYTARCREPHTQSDNYWYR